MKSRHILFGAAILLASTAQAGNNVNALDKVPLIFEENGGQTDRRVDFLSRANGYTLFLTEGDAVLRLDSTAVRMRLLGKARMPRVEGINVLPGRSNYFFGGDRKDWRTDIAQYGGVRYSSVYPGIDLVYYGKQKQLEYDFIVNPGADPAAIKLAFEGAKTINLDNAGDLLVDGLRFHKPVVYQTIDGQRVAVPGAFRTTGRQVAFNVGQYRKDLPLVIDPVLSYSTYLGGSSDDTAAAIAVDSAGNAYIAGVTLSTDFPTVTGAPISSSQNAFIAKLDPSGTALLYSTFFGTGALVTTDIAVDATGSAYFTGYGQMVSTPGAYRQCEFCSFAAKLTPTGSQMAYLTALQDATPASMRIAVTAGGSAYVVSSAGSGFPTTASAHQRTNAGGTDALIVRLNATGTAAEYATYLGGTGEDFPTDIAVDGEGNAYITGTSQSASFPTTQGALYPAGGQNVGGFVAKLNANGSALSYSTMLRGTKPTSITVRQGEVYVTGTATETFETTAGAFMSSCSQYGCNGSTFVAKMNKTGTGLAFGTFLGIQPAEYYGKTLVKVDGAGNAYVAGATHYLPNVPNAFMPFGGGSSDLYVTKLNPTGSVLLYATYVGGSSIESLAGLAIDDAGNVYVAGNTLSRNVPVTPGVFASASKGVGEVVVAKIDDANVSCAYTISSNTASYSGAQASDTIAVTANRGCAWVTDVPGASSWITVKSGGAGIGSGTVTYDVSANNSTEPRTGFITVAGQSYTITQSGAACTYSIAPQGLTLYGQGGIATVEVRAPLGCSWTAQSYANWITIVTGQNGNGYGVVRYSVSSISTGTRSGTMTIAGQTFAVTQEAGTGGCTYALSTATQTADLGGVHGVTLSTGAGCAWTAVSNAPWLTITSEASGTGNASVWFSVEANTGAARTGTLTIGGLRLTVSQAAANNCIVTVNSLGLNAPYTGLAGTIALTTSAPSCTWTATSSTPWLQVAPLTGTGNANLNYTVFPNFTTAYRNASIVVGSRLLSVVQGAAPGTQTERFLGQMYFNFFGRNASATEIAFHAGTGKTRPELVTAFFNSEEFNLAGRFVAGLYVGLLNRDAEYGGWLFQRNALATGQVNPTSLVDNFLASQEFRLQHGTLSNNQFVTLLYRQVLLREPSSAEVNFQAGALNTGTSRTTLATAFLNSAEFRMGTGPRLSAFLVHALLLQRDPTAPEFTARATQVQTGIPIQTIITEVLATPEFGALLN